MRRPIEGPTRASQREQDYYANSLKDDGFGFDDFLGYIPFGSIVSGLFGLFDKPKAPPPPPKPKPQFMPREAPSLGMNYQPQPYQPPVPVRLQAIQNLRSQFGRQG